LCRALLAPFLVRGDGGGRLRAFDQILDLHFAARLLVAALDDDARAVAPVRVFELVSKVAGIAEIKLGTDAGVTQALHHALIVADPLAVEHGNDDRSAQRLRIELAERGERGL